MILRCTRKLLAVLGSAVAGAAPAPDREDWYANLLRFDRPTCLLLTHSATPFTILEADVTASALHATRAHAEWLDAGRRELVLLGRIDGPRTCQDKRGGKGRHGRGEPFGAGAGQGAEHHAVERS